MSVTGSLLAFGVRYVFDVSADHLVGKIEEWLTDHGETLPKALARANDRAWEAVGLALAGKTLVGAAKDLFRDGDMKGVRDQVRKFLDQTDAGLGSAKAEVRAKAAEELVRLRKTRRLSTGSIPLPELARQAATMERHGDPARMVAHAHQAVTEAAAALRPEAPHLAVLLVAAPAGGTPLLAAAFAFFFRRELETDAELAHGLSFDFLRRISTQQESGLALLDGRTAGILDQFDVLFDTLDALKSQLDTRSDATDEKIDDLKMVAHNILEEVKSFNDKRHITAGATDPLRVSVATEKELAQLRHFRDVMRKLPAGLLEAADWSKLGDALAAGGLFADAWQAQQAAAEAARTAADLSAEAEAEFKAYRAACEAEKWDAALSALVRAAELDPARFAPFPLARYQPVRILGVGGFGTVFHCRDRYTRDREVAVKSLHTADLVRDLETVFGEAQTLNDLSHPGIVKVLHWDFADPAQSRPYLVLEYFPGEDLAAHIKRQGPLPIDTFVPVARQVAEAIRTAHAAGVLHRDLKPGNILIRAARRGDGSGARCEVRVIDFGLAVRAAAAQASVSTSLPQRTRREQSFAGTLEYASPEQKGRLPGVTVGRYSDVYAFGRTMQEALFGTPDPKSTHWKKLPETVREPLQVLLETATTEELEGRFRDFEPVLAALHSLDPVERARVEQARRAEKARSVPAVESPLQRVEVEHGRRGGPPRGQEEPAGFRVATHDNRNRGVMQTARKFAERGRQMAAWLCKRGRRLLAWRVLAVIGILLLAGMLAWIGAGVFWPAHLERTLSGDANYYVWSPDGKKLLTYYKGEKPVIWDIGTGRKWCSLDGIPDDDNDSIRAEWSPASDAVLIVDRRQTVRIWDTGSAGYSSPTRTFKTESNSSVTASWHPKERKILVAGIAPLRPGMEPRGYAAVWDVTTGQYTTTIRFDNSLRFGIEFATWSRDGTRILTRNKTADTYWYTVWDASGQQIAELPESSTDSRGWATWSPDGSKILVLDRGEKTVSVREPSSGKRVHTLAGHTAAIAMAYWNPQGTHVLTIGQDKTVRVWDAAAGVEVFAVSDDAQGLSTTWSPDGSRVLTGTQDGNLRAWDVATKREVCLIPSHYSPGRWSSDGTRILTTDGEKELKVWNASTGDLIATFRNARRRFYGGVWQPGGDRVASMDEANTVRIWIAPKVNNP